jgi:hypothetical protein
MHTRCETRRAHVTAQTSVRPINYSSNAVDKLVDRNIEIIIDRLVFWYWYWRVRNVCTRYHPWNIVVTMYVRDARPPRPRTLVDTLVRDRGASGGSRIHECSAGAPYTRKYIISPVKSRFSVMVSSGNNEPLVLVINYHIESYIIYIFSMLYSLYENTNISNYASVSGLTIMSSDSQQTQILLQIVRLHYERPNKVQYHLISERGKNIFLYRNLQ